MLGDSPPTQADLHPGRSGLPRSLFALAALVAGFIIARHLPALSPPLLLAAGGGLIALAALLRALPCRIALAVGVVCLGAGWFEHRVGDGVPPEPWASLAQTAEIAGTAPAAAIIEVEAVVLQTPRVRTPQRDPLRPMAQTTWRFPVSVRALHGDSGVAPARGVLIVRGTGGLEGAAASLRAGDVVRVMGTFEPTPRRMNPGEPDRALLAAQERRVGSLEVGRSVSVRIESSAADSASARARSWWLGIRATMADRARAILLGDPDDPDPRLSDARGLLSALLLGQTEPGADELRRAFANLGLAHVLSISGFHLTVMVGFALLALRVGGDLGRWEPLLIAALLAAYLFILPFNAPVWRSALLVAGLLLADALGRRYDPLAVLGWIAILILLYAPLDAWSPGFQLSFGLVAVLIRLGLPFHHRLWGEPLRGVEVGPRGGWPWWVVGAMDAFRALVSTCLLCWMVSIPVVAFHTGVVSTVGAPVSVVAIPVVSLLLMGGYAALMVGVLVPPLGEAAAWVVGELAAVIAWSVRAADDLPGMWVRVPALSVAWCVAGSAVLLAAAARWGWWRQGRHGVTLALAGLAVWTAIECARATRLPRGDVLRLDTLAVGDGTAHLLRSGGDAILWDCGSLQLGPGLGQRLVPRAVRAVGGWRVATAVISHPNLDHFSAMPEAAEALGVRLVLTPPVTLERARERPWGPEAYALERLRGLGIEVRTIEAGDRLRLGEVEIEILSPPPGVDWREPNDHSLVALARQVVEAGGRGRDGGRGLLLLTGDVQDLAIEHLRDRVPGLVAEVIELPHHGSAREAAVRWSTELEPRVVVQSTGRRRAGDERWDALRTQLAERGGRWWTTALDGSVWVRFGRDGSVRSGSHAAP